MLDKLTFSDFQPHLGSEFAVLGCEPQRVLVLHEVQTLVEHGKTRVPFSLVFLSSRTDEPTLAQQILRLEHPVMNDLAIFMVPIGPNPDGLMQYQAIFY